MCVPEISMGPRMYLNIPVDSHVTIARSAGAGSRSSIVVGSVQSIVLKSRRTSCVIHQRSEYFVASG